MSFLTKIFGSSNQRALKRMQVYVDKINLLESEYQQLSDDDLAGLRIKLKESSKDSDFDLLAHAFAATREASVRTIGLRHFDAQMLGGIALSEGNIAEMKTGDSITVRDKSKKLDIILNAIKMVKGDLNISWLSVDKAKMEGTFVSFPERDEIDLTLNEQLVVEYYSR